MTLTEPLWPESFLSPDLGPDHCRDVLEGCYDVPFNHSPKVIDIGANVGAFARWAKKRCKHIGQNMAGRKRLSP